MSGMFDFLPPWARTKAAAALVVAALQIGVLTWIVLDRVLLVKNGQEIVLPIVPVDPRDLFKGDYVRLGYQISRAPGTVVEKPEPAYKQQAYATIAPNVEGVWAVTKISVRYPQEVPAGSSVVQVRTQGPWQMRSGQLLLTYGLERFYVPEGKGLALEKAARDKKLAAIVAVDTQGRTAIKGLSIDGTRVYDEPMW
ncbi:MAG: GDYXXLXY domain-containing protein [Hyphomicrobiaceae bacterium]